MPETDQSEPYPGCKLKFNQCCALLINSKVSAESEFMMRKTPVRKPDKLENSNLDTDEEVKRQNDREENRQDKIK